MPELIEEVGKSIETLDKELLMVGLQNLQILFRVWSPIWSFKWKSWKCKGQGKIIGLSISKGDI